MSAKMSPELELFVVCGWGRLPSTTRDVITRVSHYACLRFVLYLSAVARQVSEAVPALRGLDLHCMLQARLAKLVSQRLERAMKRKPNVNYKNEEQWHEYSRSLRR